MYHQNPPSRFKGVKGNFGFLDVNIKNGEQQNS